MLKLESEFLGGAPLKIREAPEIIERGSLGSAI
jgi:hypothetical protein